jgi:hypothetical protein
VKEATMFDMDRDDFAGWRAGPFVIEHTDRHLLRRAARAIRARTTSTHYAAANLGEMVRKAGQAASAARPRASLSGNSADGTW